MKFNTRKILLIALLSSSYSFSQCFVKIVSGEQHTIAIADNGTLWGWGSNSSGEAGISASYPNHVNVPTQIGVATNWTDIECGSYHTLALNSDNELYTWGFNNSGQLGHGDFTVRTSPTLINGEWKGIGAGSNHSFAISVDGNLYGTGQGSGGQLGDNLATSYSVFTTVASGNNWKDITGGSNFSLALQNDGTLYAAGNNGNGQLGKGDLNSSNYWVATATTITGWDKIDAGLTYSMALTNNGTLYSWGYNALGQLGQNGTTQQNAPQPVDINITGFACGAESSIWKTSTSVFTSGANGFYQSQPGTLVDVTTPYEWTTITNHELVTMGIFSSTVVTSSGILTWGRNDRGICGNGNFTNVTSPTLVSLSCGATTSLESTEIFNGKIYPNPVEDQLNIQLSEAGTIIITDINGKQLIQSDRNTLHKINTSKLASGIYLVQTENGALQKFVKH